MDASTAPKKLTVSEFIDWADAQSDGHRYELLNGEIVAQAATVKRHSRVAKGMEAALDSVLPDCETVREAGVLSGNDASDALEADLAVYCEEMPGDDTRYDGSPVIIVEILSPSTARYDMGEKRASYQKIESLQHYLIVHPEERFVLIHSAGPARDWSIVRAAREDFALEPPGVIVPFEMIFALLQDDAKSV